jgi:hypothetical protein
LVEARSYRDSHGACDVDQGRRRPAATRVTSHQIFNELAGHLAAANFFWCELICVEQGRRGVRTAAPAVGVIGVEQLAKVVSSHVVATPGNIGIRNGFLTMPLPYTLTEYYTPTHRGPTSSAGR